MRLIMTYIFPFDLMRTGTPLYSWIVLRLLPLPYSNVPYVFVHVWQSWKANNDECFHILSMRMLQ